MEQLGEKFIDGRLINLEKEDIKNLERHYKNVLKCETKSRDELDELLTKLMSE